MFRKLSVLERIKNVSFREKSLWWTSVLLKSQSGSTLSFSFIKKAELKEDLPVEALKVLIYSQLSVPDGGFSFAEILGLEFIPAISLKITPSQRFSYKGSCRVALFKLLRDFLRDTFAKHVLTLLKISCLTKKYRPNFQL